MAYRIHKTANTNTLETVSLLYYACKLPNGSNDPVRLQRIIQGIRAGTPTDLTSFDDDENLGAGKVLYVPTTRAVDIALFAGPTELKTALIAGGLETSRHLLAKSASQVSASGFASGVATRLGRPDDIERTLTINAFLTLDGMDLGSAVCLYDTAEITSLDELKTQSVASVDSIIDDIVTAGAPAVLADQGHGSRWRTAAWIATRGREAQIEGALWRPMRWTRTRSYRRCATSKWRARATLLTGWDDPTRRWPAR